MGDLHLNTGGADTQKLKQFGQTGLGGISANDPVPWDPNWHHRFDDWKTKDDCPSPITLVFSPTPSIEASKHSCTIFYQLGAIAIRPECGVYIVGRAAVGNGWKLASSSDDHQKNCESVKFENLDSYPTIVIGLSKGSVIFYPNGIKADTAGHYLPPPNPDSPLDDTILCKELDDFATNNLAADELRGELWEDAGKYWAIEHAETTIQKYLLIALRSVFKKYEFTSETKVAAGRIDILILPGSSTEAGRSVLELKALRQYGSTGLPVTSNQLTHHIKDGVLQAFTYFKDATHKYICTYDMRKIKDEKVFDEPMAECQKYDVKLRRYVVYNSAVEVRKSRQI